jgi:hypothetical protein
MHPTLRRGAVVVLLLLSAGCSGPTSPTPPTFPPLSGPGRIFVYDHALSDYLSDSTSRYVLYDNGTFVLQYLSHASEFRGGYTVANGVVTFGWDVTDTWGATGTLNGNSLTVKYNEGMQNADFVDAVYVLAP